VNFVTPDPADFDAVCRVLIIPAGYAPCVMGALAELAKPYRWKVGVDSIDDAVTKMADMIDSAYESDCALSTNVPTEAFVFWNENIPPIGNAVQAQLSTLQPFNTFWRQNTPAITDIMPFYVMLVEGTYDLTLCYVKDSGCAICHVVIDGAEDSQTIDMYSASQVFNQETTISIAVVGSGRHLIEFKASSKNASSGNYRQPVTYFKLHRTGD
jgi:hypothetical protein